MQLNGLLSFQKQRRPWAIAAACVLLMQADARWETSAAQQADITNAEASDKRGVGRPDHLLPSRPENIAWGWFPLDNPPALTIQSGDTVRINTLTGSGATGTANTSGVLRAVWRSARRNSARCVRILADTGRSWRTAAGASNRT